MTDTPTPQGAREAWTAAINTMQSDAPTTVGELPVTAFAALYPLAAHQATMQDPAPSREERDLVVGRWAVGERATSAAHSAGPDSTPQPQATSGMTLFWDGPDAVRYSRGRLVNGELVIGDVVSLPKDAPLSDPFRRLAGAQLPRILRQAMEQKAAQAPHDGIG